MAGRRRRLHGRLRIPSVVALASAVMCFQPAPATPVSRGWGEGRLAELGDAGRQETLARGAQIPPQHEEPPHEHQGQSDKPYGAPPKVDGDDDEPPAEPKHGDVKYTATEEERMAKGEPAEYYPEMHSGDIQSQVPIDNDVSVQQMNRNVAAPSAQPSPDEVQERAWKRNVQMHQILFKQHKFEMSQRGRHDSVEPFGPGSVYQKAEAALYPGGGKMIPQDVHRLAYEDVPRALKKIRKANTDDEKLDATESDVLRLEKKMVQCAECKANAPCRKSCDAAIATVKAKLQAATGQTDVQGQLTAQVTAVRAELAKCRAQIVACVQAAPSAPRQPIFSDDTLVKGDGGGARETLLGEAQTDGMGEVSLPEDDAIQNVRTTARDEDNTMRGVKDPVTEERAAIDANGGRVAYINGVPATATDQYVHAQATKPPWHMMDGTPGMKLPHDTMKSSEVSRLVDQSKELIEEGQKEDQQDDMIQRRKVDAANQKAVIAISAAGMARAEIPAKLLKVDEQTSFGPDPLDQLKKYNEEYQGCVKEQVKQCA